MCVVPCLTIASHVNTFLMFNSGVLLNDRCAVGHSFQMMTLTGQETKALQLLMVQGLCLTILLALQQVIHRDITNIHLAFCC